MNEFEKIGLSKKLTDVLDELKFEKPSDIQARTIPLILEGKDVIGNAATGSGKTLAFASGIIEKVIPGEGIQALILTPTRELADQITTVMRKFASKTRLEIHEIYGGVDLERQVRRSRRADIIVATPGRVLDHLKRKSFNFSKIKILVLDEADRMVDMGFLPDVQRIIEDCSKERQTLLFSATTSPDVDYISKKYMKNPKEITVEKYVDASNLKQFYYDTPDRMKFSLLVHLLEKEKNGIVMIFCNTRRNVDSLTMNLKRYKINALAIHGGLDQKKRMRIIEQFHTNQVNVMVCTDVAARGLDIQGVTHVYNYDISKTSQEYVHRVGRTARAGKKGLAVNIVTSRDYENFKKVLEDESLKIDLKELPENMERLVPIFKKDDRKGKNFRPGRRTPGHKSKSYGRKDGRASGRDRRQGSPGREGRKKIRDESYRSVKKKSTNRTFRRGHNSKSSHTRGRIKSSKKTGRR